MWKIKKPSEAEEKILSQKLVLNGKEAQNLEEKAISLVGLDIYEKLIKGYTQKQWGKTCDKLPSSIIRRLPVRFTYDNNYYTDRYQGIPIGGYTAIFEKLLAGVEVLLECDFLEDINYFSKMANKIIYTGSVDALLDYEFGELSYRGLRFETETINTRNYQGVAVINYTDSETPFTRIIEHKHFEFGTQDKTIISREYPKIWNRSEEPFYPINDEENTLLYNKYRTQCIQKFPKIVLGGRLGQYQYYDMQDTIISALNLIKSELQ
jgi:UDP-galactopyranose mutase